MPIALPGAGNLEHTKVGLYVTSTGSAHSIRRSSAAFRMSVSLALDVVPPTTCRDGQMQRLWIQGTEGCSLDDICTKRGLRIAVFDYIAGGYIGRPMWQNVIRDIKGILWAIDNEHAFRPISEYGVDWEFGGLSAFLMAWIRPTLWWPHEKCIPILESFMSAFVPKLKTTCPTHWGLNEAEEQEAMCRVEMLLASENLGKAWKAWRTLADRTWADRT